MSKKEIIENITAGTLTGGALGAGTAALHPDIEKEWKNIGEATLTGAIGLGTAAFLGSRFSPAQGKQHIRNLIKTSAKKKDGKKPFLSENQIDPIAGAISGAAATTSVFPLSRLSTLVQVGKSGDEGSTKYHTPKGGKKSPKGFKNFFKNMDPKDAKKLYSGLAAKLPASIGGSMVGYGVYGATRRLLNDTMGPNSIKDNKELKKQGAINRAMEKIDKSTPGELQQYSHTDESGNVGKKNMKTSDAIDALVQEWVDRAPPKGVRKDIKGYNKTLEKKAFWGTIAKFAPKVLGGAKNFSKGLSGFGNLKTVGGVSGEVAGLAVPKKLNFSKNLSNYGKYKPSVNFKKNFNLSTSRTNTIK